MGEQVVYENGVKKLIDLNTHISELYREINEMTHYLKMSNAESVLYDSIYLREFFFKKEALIHVYEQMLIQICINHSFDMKSWKTGHYSYDRFEIESKVEEFNQLFQCAVKVEDVVKSLRFDQEMDINVPRVEK